MFLDFITNSWNIIAFVICLLIGLYTYFLQKDNRSLWNILPSFSTGVGVLLTFLVLYINLSGEKINWEDPKLIEKIVPKLASAFSTSIIGVGFSLIYSVLNRVILHKKDIIVSKTKPYLQTHPNELLHYIQKGIEVLNSENEGLKGAINGLKSSNEVQMKALSEAINNLVKNVNEEVRNIITTLQGQLEAYIETIGKNAIDTSNQQISAINQEFLDDTHALMKANQVQLSAQFGNLEGVFEMLVSKIEALSVDFNAQTNTTQSAFNNAVHTMTESLGSQANQLIANTQNQLGATVEETNSILTRNLGSLEKTFSNIEKWQNTSKLALEEVTKEFVGAVNEYQSIGEQNKVVLEEVKKQLAEIERIRKTEEDILDMISHYDKTLDDSKNKVDDVYNSISKLGQLESRLAKITQ